MIGQQHPLMIDDELVVDLFAGGGGASSGIEAAIGRPVDIAVNHNPEAIAMHEANHPQTRHFCESVWDVDPRIVTEGRQVALLHASPDCTHFSQAKGGQPRDRAIRSLSWVVHRWAGAVRPKVITLENVEQILTWSPLIAKRDPATGRVVKTDESVAAPGERVPVDQQYLVPCKRRKGRNWRHFVEGLRRMGYVVQWRKIVAADFGAPTLVTMGHGEGSGPTKRAGTGTRPITDPVNTITASGGGVGAACAYLMQANGGFNSVTGRAMTEPVSTITNTGSQQQLVTAHLATLRHHSTGTPAGAPLSTIAAGGEHHALVQTTLAPADEANALRVAAFLINYYGNGQPLDLCDPADTITTRDRLALVTVTVRGVPHVIVDIGLRMLAPRELYSAQGFAPDYIIDRTADGTKLTKTAQVRMCGNSVSPKPMQYIVAANYPAQHQYGRKAA